MLHLDIQTREMVNPGADLAQTIFATGFSFIPLSRAGWTATADDSTYGAASGAIDGSAGAWISGPGLPHWLRLDMQAARTFNRIQITPNQSNAIATAYALDVSNDGTNWTNTGETISGLPNTVTLQDWTLSASYTTRYARVRSTAGATYTSIQEINLGMNTVVVTSAVIDALGAGRYKYPMIANFINEVAGVTGLPIWGTWNFCDGMVGIEYDHQWDLEGCGRPITYTLASGALPDGLTLSTGYISGTPTVAGAFAFTLRATNSFGQADQTFLINIAAPPEGGGGGRFSIAY